MKEKFHSLYATHSSSYHIYTDLYTLSLVKIAFLNKALVILPFDVN